MASGIEGSVTIGPVSAENQDSSSHGYEPFETTIVFKEAAMEREVAAVRSGADGTFRVSLPPGEYIVEPASSNQFVPPYSDPQRVTVRQGRVTFIEIIYDTGIR
jgi:hypothetical protein